MSRFLSKEKLLPLLIFIGDLIVVPASFWIAYQIRFGTARGFSEKFPWILLLLLPLVYVSTFFLFGLYQSLRKPLSLNFLGKMLSVVLVGSMGASLVKYIFSLYPIGRGILLLASFLIFISATAWRIFCVRSVKHMIVPKNVLLIGTGKPIADAIEILGSIPEDYRVVGCLGRKASGPSSEGSAGNPCTELGPVEDLLPVVESQRVDLVILATARPFSAKLVKDLLMAESNGVRVANLLEVYQRLKRIVPIDYIQEGKWFLKCEEFNALNLQLRARFKRFVDVILGSLILLLSLPLWPIIILLIKATSKGPVFYSQERIGKNRVCFNIYKFRSMIDNAERDEPLWAEENDHRVTAVGRFLRRFHLDELPQLWNVIKGEMSLVGPRPERPFFVEKLMASIPYYNLRLLVKPGITGWAQINYSYVASLEDSKRKLEYDLYYLTHFNFFMDLKILQRTIQGMLFFDKSTHA